MNKAWRLFFLILFLSIFSVSCSLIPDKDFSEGRGTEESPYIISNWEEFQKVTNSTPKYYKLAQDIEFVGEPLSAPLGIFYGHLDGNGKSITNLKIIIDEWTSAAGEKVGNMGLFSEMAKGSSIDDIRIEDAELLVSYAGEATVGMLVGEKDPNSILTNVFVSGFISVIARDGRVGGIVGKGTNFTNLTSDIFLDVISSDYDVNAGGIAGSIVGGEVDRLRSSGEIHIGGGDTLLHDKYAHAVGGIVGYLTGSMTHALSDVDLYCNVEQYDNNIGFYAGGLVGSLADESISQSLSMGTIVSDLSNITYLGGAVGYVSSGYVLNVLAVSPIITYGTEETDDVIGGVLGKANSDSDARNVYYVNDLGFESAVAMVEDNPLYHNSVTTFDLRTLTSIPNFDDSWDFSGVSYPTLNIGNLPIKGNIDSPRLITSVADFNDMYLHPWAYFSLESDLALDYFALEVQFGYDRPFCGVFFGNGHVIRGLGQYPDDQGEYSLFGNTSGAIIENFRLIEVDIQSMTLPMLSTFGLIANTAKNTEIRHVEVEGNVKLEASSIMGRIGLLVGSLEGSSTVEEIVVNASFQISLQRDFNMIEDLSQMGYLIGEMSGEGQTLQNVVLLNRLQFYLMSNYSEEKGSQVVGLISDEDVTFWNIYYTVDSIQPLYELVGDTFIHEDDSVLFLDQEGMSLLDPDVFLYDGETIHLIWPE